jgi:IS30 family transposase
MSGRGKKLTKDEREKIVELYAQGVPMREIARTIGRSYGAVNLALHRQDEVEVNPRGGYRRPEQTSR